MIYLLLAGIVVVLKKKLSEPEAGCASRFLLFDVGFDLVF